jgi:phospholipid/cholesterol/gamma-HCH transport system substrate-binding protein
MDTAESKRSIIVGLFIALGIAIFVVGIFTLGSQQKSFANGIHIGAVFSDVSGLKKGNNVWFSGVKVGTISSIKFTGIERVDVEMNIDKTLQPFIHRNAGVRISSEGFIGNKIIVIDGGSPNAPVIQNGDMLQSSKILSTDDIMSTLQKNNENIYAITNDFKVLSRKIVDGKGTVGALMTDSTLAIQFRNILQNLERTTNTTARMAGQLNNFSSKLNNKGTLADNLLTDTVTFGQLQSAVQQLKQTSTNAATLTDNLNRASNKLNTTDNALGVLLNDPKTAAQLKSTMDQLQQSSNKLNDDLEAAQHNFLLRGFFKDREKKKKQAEKNNKPQ